MRRCRGTALILCAALLTAVLGGCKTEEAGVRGGETGAFVGMEPEPVLDYEVPESLPGILVDRGGYQTGADKCAVMRGRKLPVNFELVDAATGETVYIGNIEKAAYIEEQDLYTGCADFSAYDMEGEYYLECGIIGRSYLFEISGDLYGERFRQVLAGVEEAFQEPDAPKSGREREELLDQTAMVLLSYELCADVYDDINGNGIPEALDLAAEQVGKLRAWRDTSGELPDTALYCAVLAKFSYLYQKFDKSYAAECLKDAAGTFVRLEKEGAVAAGQDTGGRAADPETAAYAGNGKDTAYAGSREDACAFWALAELYRAAGRQEYRWKLREYQDFFEGRSALPEDQEYLFGAMTYLCTRQRVEKDFCDVLMSLLLQEGERVEAESDELLSPVSGSGTGTGELLEKAVVLILANYVLVNYKYDRTLEDIGHYLAGQNPQAESRYSSGGSGEEEPAGGMDAADQTRYLLLLGRLAMLYAGGAE